MSDLIECLAEAMWNRPMTALAVILLIVGAYWWPATVAAVPVVWVLSRRAKRARNPCAETNFSA